MKTVKQHINDIINPEMRAKCLESLDERCADLECYSLGYALMIGVNQLGHERAYWENTYWELHKESPSYFDHTAFYFDQTIQQDTKSGKK